MLVVTPQKRPKLCVLVKKKKKKVLLRRAMSKAPLAHTHTTEKSSAGSIFKLLIDRGYSFAPNPPPPPPPKRPSLLHLCFRCCEDGVFRLLAHSSPNGFDDARSWAKPFRIAGAYKSEKKKKNSLRQRETTNVFGYFIPANCFAAEKRKREREKKFLFYPSGMNAWFTRIVHGWCQTLGLFLFLSER